jgi:hypothetical protein
MTEKLILFIIISVLSLINNLLVTYAIYYKKFGFFKKRPKDFLGVNAWGIIMDGLLAAIMNIITINFLYEVKPDIKTYDLIVSLIIALVITTASHIFMVKRQWKIWIMPSPGHFNEAGFWHMFSMTAQTFFLSYPLIILINNRELLTSPVTKSTLTEFFILSVLYVLTLYCYDNKKEISIGKIAIKSSPW